MGKASRKLISEIDERLRKIQDNPEFFSERAAMIETGIKNEADLHSFWLEHPELRSRLLLLTGAADEKEIRNIARKGIKHIKKAWGYLTSPELKESKTGVLGYLTPEVISQVGKYVDPKKNHTGFRQDYVDSPFPEYTPRSPILIPDMIRTLCNEIKSANDEHSYHPIELAAEAHLRIAGIQPFKEGNKRTARLIERRILEGFGLPTSFIPLGERQVYLDLVTRALTGLNEREVYKQAPFFDYIGGKVVVALDKIIDDLNI